MNEHKFKECPYKCLVSFPSSSALVPASIFISNEETLNSDNSSSVIMGSNAWKITFEVRKTIDLKTYLSCGVLYGNQHGWLEILTLS